LDKNYDPQQKKAILSPIDLPLVIYAGPGSGKTRTLTGRVARFVVEGVPPEKIVVITFTKKAAKALKERLGKLLGENVSLGFVGTFHSFGATLLRALGGYRDRDREFIIYDEKDQVDLMKKVILSLYSEGGVNVFEACERVDYFKRNLMFPEEVRERNEYREVYEEYDRWLKRQNACDFGDLLLLPVRRLSEFKGDLERMKERYVYFFVDEYQDVNLAQYKMLKLFEGDRGFITVVGDEDQAIYGWRGAEFEYVLRFKKDFKGAREVVLNVNYRSPATIVMVASRLIQHNEMRTQKKLKATFDEFNAVVYRVFESSVEEAEWVVDYIEGKRREGCKYEQFAILYRANYQSRLFEYELVNRGIPYTVVKGQRFFARKEVKDFLALLRILISPSSSLDWSRVAAVFVKGVGERTLEKVFEKYGDPFQFEEAFSKEGKRPKTSTEVRLLRFVRTLKELREKAETPGAFVELCADAFEYRETLISSYGEIEGEMRYENVEELKEALEHAYRSHGGEFREFISNFLAEVVLEAESDQKTRGVSLLTLHSAKGLEFDYVFVIGFEQGNLPHHLGEIEEERRLAYVGITRAKKRVFITRVISPRHPKSRRFDWVKPSIFLMEMGFEEGIYV